MGDSSLRATVKAFQAGSCEAFAELVACYQNLATSIAFANSGDLQRSEDIAQQAFLVAWQKQKELVDPDRFAGWIRGIVTNVARNERRLKENRVQKLAVELAEHHESATNVTPEMQASRAEQNELLWKSLNRIPLEYREPLVLFYREDLSVAKVAEQLELSIDVVRQRLSRGRKMLKQEVETMVEDFLADSKPAGQFTAGVIAALPSVSATAKSAAIKVATAKAGQATLGSGAIAGTLFSGAILGLVGGLAGSLFGLFGAWIGIRSGIKQATSEDEVKEHRKLFRNLALLTLALLLGMLAFVQLPGIWLTVAMAAVQLVFVGALGMLILRFNRRQTELHRVHGIPNSYAQTANVRSDSPQSNRSQFWNGLGGSAGAIIGSCAWLIVLAIRLQVWWLLGLVVLLIGLLIVRSVNVFSSDPKMPQAKVFKHMQGLCRDLGVTHCMLVLLLWATGALAPTQGTIEGYPVWVMMVFILVLCKGLHFGMGYAAETARGRERGGG